MTTYTRDEFLKLLQKKLKELQEENKQLRLKSELNVQEAITNLGSNSAAVQHGAFYYLLKTNDVVPLSKQIIFDTLTIYLYEMSVDIILNKNDQNPTLLLIKLQDLLSNPFEDLYVSEKTLNFEGCNIHDVFYDLLNNLQHQNMNCQKRDFNIFKKGLQKQYGDYLYKKYYQQPLEDFEKQSDMNYETLVALEIEKILKKNHEDTMFVLTQDMITLIDELINIIIFANIEYNQDQFITNDMTKIAENIQNDIKNGKLKIDPEHITSKEIFVKKYKDSNNDEWIQHNLKHFIILSKEDEEKQRE